MTPHEGGDKAASRHDLETSPPSVVERGPHQLRADALSFIRGRHLGMGEDGAIALLTIDRDRSAVFGIELVTALRRVVSYLHRSLSRRECWQTPPHQDSLAVIGVEQKGLVLRLSTGEPALCCESAPYGVSTRQSTRSTNTSTRGPSTGTLSRVPAAAVGTTTRDS